MDNARRAQRFPMTPGFVVILSTALFTLSSLGFELYLSGRCTGFIAALRRAHVQRMSNPDAGDFAVAIFPMLVAIACVPIVILRLVQNAPRAVRLDKQALWIERLAATPVQISWNDITRVEPGPRLGLIGPLQHRAGSNPWVLGITGPQTLARVGAVQCWATRLGTATVLVHRVSAEPVLLGVDDGEALLRALAQRMECSTSTGEAREDCVDPGEAHGWNLPPLR